MVLMPRRRVSLADSFRKATGGPAEDRDHYSSGLVAVWYWIVGEPINELESNAERRADTALAELARASLLLPVTRADLNAYNALLDIGEIEAAMEELERMALTREPPTEFWAALSVAAVDLAATDAAARYSARATDDR
jgi:hypothetical protein